jgi:hypothetical protein
VTNFFLPFFTSKQRRDGDGGTEGDRTTKRLPITGKRPAEAAAPARQPSKAATPAKAPTMVVTKETEMQKKRKVEAGVAPKVVAVAASTPASASTQRPKVEQPPVQLKAPAVVEVREVPPPKSIEEIRKVGQRLGFDVFQCNAIVVLSIITSGDPCYTGTCVFLYRCYICTGVICDGPVL